MKKQVTLIQPVPLTTNDDDEKALSGLLTED